MHSRKIISVARTGTMTFLADPDLQGLILQGNATVTRASHVEPLDLPRRLLFRRCRLIFGENGRVAEWTRQWRCQWRVDLAPSGGPVLAPFNTRDAAISAEIDWLRVNANH